MPRRKPKVIRHITTQDSDSEELPEVRLEPSDTEEKIPEDEEEQMDPPEENGEEEAVNGEIADDDVSEVVDEEKEEKEEKKDDDEEDEVTLVNGDGVKITTDEKGNEVLPDGTLIIQPEEVSSENDSFSGPEFKKNTKKPALSDLEGTYKCSSCHEQLNHNNPKQVAKHDHLGVLLCRSCHKYLQSEFDIDDEGSEEQCTWCGEGGKLVCCDSCPKAFCRSCIKTNLGRAELSNILADEEEQWLCYVCNPAPLNELIEECKTVFYHLKNPKKDTKKPKSKDGKSANKNKKKGEEEETADIMKVMQLLGDKSSSKNLLENLVKGRSPKGLKKTLDFFKNIKKISEGLEKRIKNELDDDEEGEGDDEEEEEGVTEDKSSAESSEVDKDKKKSSKAGKEEDEKSDAEKSKKKKGKEEGSGSEEDDKKSTKEVKKTKKDKKDGKKTKPSSTSPSEDDVPGTSSGSVKGNKSNRKGRRSLFKAQQKEKTTTSSDESDESSEPESSVEDSDWEEESGVKDRRRRRGSKKGKAGGKLSAKKGRADSSDDDSEDDDDDKKKKKKSSKKGRAESSDDDSEDDNNKKKKKSSKKAKGRAESSDDDAEDDDKKKKKKEKSKSKGGDSDPEIQFPKKKKKDLKADSSNAEQSSSDEEGSKKKKDQKKKDQKKKDPPKGTTKSKKSKDGDISLSSDYDEESEEESEESSADEIMQKIKKAKQNAVKGTMENKQDLESDAEDKIAERLLMEEAEEDDESGGSESDSDLDDAKKKRDKRNKKGGKKRKKKSSSEDDGDDKSSKKKKRKKTSTDDEDDSEEDSKSKEKKKKKGRRKKNETSDSEDDSDNDGNEKDSKSKNKKGKKGSKKKKKHHLLEVNISASESDEEKGKGKKKKKRRRKKMKKIDDSDFMTSAESGSDSDVKTKRRKVKRGTDGSTEDEVQDRSYKKKKGKRRRIKDAGSTSSDSGSESGSDKKAKKSGDDSVKEASGMTNTCMGLNTEPLSSNKTNMSLSCAGHQNQLQDTYINIIKDQYRPMRFKSGSDDQDTPGKKRVMIRQVLKKSKLLKTTLEAERAEKDRRDRIKKRREEMYGEMASPAKSKKVKELVLEYNDDKEVVLEVDKRIVKHLKPHQVDGVQFLWESTFECVEKKNEPGGGAILAHCMGLGKTLQIITYLHTVMSSEDLNVKRAIVVCPLNTVLNWVEEFNKWLPFDDSIDVYEITSVRNNESRADMLEQWHEEGGVLVMGYSMYRILALNKFKKKRLKRIFHETLVNPGPCVVVCDEGHMLKNSQTAIAKALNSVKTRRRICLTGTPLQNNLIEYHCMVDFVKPNLLGSQKEYKNRFVNPITNGQCSDSNRRDVRIMKHRAHILHDLLAGCVQRKDYSVITKFLPPKHEYVLSIRLSPKQVKLYEVYLGQYSGMKREDGEPAVQQRSASVFADYQALMRIWTHPQVLKLNTIREENKAFLDMDGFVTSEDDTDGSSIDDFLDDRKSSDSGRNSDLEEVAPVTLTPDNKSRATRASRRQTQVVTAPPLSAPMRKPRRNGIKIDSSDEEGGDGHKSDSSLEIIKTWKSRSRTLDPENDDVAAGTRTPTPTLKRKEWYDEYFDPVKDAYNLELSGKLNLLFEILRHCETVGEKILVFSQSLLSLDLIEDFLEHLNKQAEEDREKGTQDLDAQIGGKGAWIKGEDYFRMDGSTSAAYRHHWCEVFNEVENMRARLFLISTKAGSLGINLVGANRVIIFDASWNPSHDTQSIFRVYRFGQERPVFIYRFVAQGTMEEKIYERQIAKQSLSQRVVDEHQIERHFSAGQLQELYTFTPDRLDDPDREDIPIPKLPKDHILADLLEERKEWIVKYHEQDSLLENKIDEELNEEERKAAWDEYNKEKEGRTAYMQQFQQGQAGSAQWLQHYGMPAGGTAGATPMMLQKLYEDGSSVLQAGQNILGQQQQQYRALTLNGYNPYGWPSGAYAAHSQAINGVTYRVPITQYDQSILMSQYQALQQQRQRNLQMMPQGQAGNQSVSQLLSHQAQQVQVARQQQAANSYSNSMSTLLSRMSQQNQQATAPLQQVTAAQQQQVTAAQQQQATAAKQQQATAGGAASAAAAGGVSLLAKKPASQLFEALKKTAAEQQKQPQPKQPQPPPKQQNGGGKVNM